MRFTVVFDLFVALGFHYGTVFQLEAVEGVFKVGFLDQHAWKAAGLKRNVVQPFRPCLWA